MEELDPFGLVLGAADPTAAIGGFDDENAGVGNDEVFDPDTGGSVWVGQLEIVEVAVGCRIKPAQCAEHPHVTEAVGKEQPGDELGDDEKG